MSETQPTTENDRREYGQIDVVTIGIASFAAGIAICSGGYRVIDALSDRNTDGNTFVHDTGSPKEMASAAEALATGYDCEVTNIFNNQYVTIDYKGTASAEQVIDKYDQDIVSGQDANVYFVPFKDVRQEGAKNAVDTQISWGEQESLREEDSPQYLRGERASEIVLYGDWQYGDDYGYEYEDMYPSVVPAKVGKYVVVVGTTGVAKDRYETWSSTGYKTCGAIEKDKKGAWRITEVLPAFPNTISEKATSYTN